MQSKYSGTPTKKKKGGFQLGTNQKKKVNEYLPHSWDVCKSVYHTNAKGAVFSNFLPAHGAETKNCRVTAEGTRSRSVVLLRTLNFFEVVG